MIMTHKGGDGEHADATHVTRIRRGANGEVVIPDCEGGQPTNIEEGSGNERTRIML